MPFSDGVFYDPADKLYAGSSARKYAAPGTLVKTADDAVAPGGSGAAHDNMQPFLAVNYIIALEGVYPSRN